jgi:hypothetical protein
MANVSSWASHPKMHVGADFRGFYPNFIFFSIADDASDGPYSYAGVWRIL